MGIAMLPDELLLALADQWPCREVQLKQLAALLSVSPSAPLKDDRAHTVPSHTFQARLLWRCMDHAQRAKVV